MLFTRARFRLIPAHAGKTLGIKVDGDVCEAHPRSRGENSLIIQAVLSREGSSPLTRGKRRLQRHHHGLHGLIPAHAGKTLISLMVVIGDPAHPRSRGENGLGNPRRPPLLGLIPAHAGKTSAPSPSSPFSEAHPRSRGENFKHGIEAPLDLGSSPLTRGKRRSGCQRPCLRGLIPAHAGKTHYLRRLAVSGSAHPRSRGEN